MAYELASDTYYGLGVVTKVANVIQHDLKLLVICQRELRNQDPCKKVQLGQTEVVEVVSLHMLPTMCYGKSPYLLF